LDQYRDNRKLKAGRNYRQIASGELGEAGLPSFGEHTLAIENAV
jgi:hypothetical protein